MFEELRNACRPGMVGGFLPGMKQIANVAALPGIVGKSVGLPDVHAGYGFAIGNQFYSTVFRMLPIFPKIVIVGTNCKISKIPTFLAYIRFFQCWTTV